MNRHVPSISGTAGLLAVFVSAAVSRAQEPVPIGPPFPVAGVDFQAGSAAAMDEHGRFVVLFYQFFGGYSLRGYGPDGEPAAPFPAFLDPYAPAWSSDGYEATAFGPDDFLVVRENDGQEIWARRYRVDGAAIGPLLVVDALPADGFGTVTLPAVALWKLDRFVTTWVEDLGDGDPDGRDILLRVLSVDGSGGLRYPVNTFLDGDQTSPEVAGTPNGPFAVVWTSEGSPGDDDDGTSIQARYFFPPAGTPGPQFQVNDVTEGDQSRPDVAIGADGRALVVWRGPPEAGSVDSIRGRLLATDGTPVGPELAISQPSTEHALAPRVVAQPDGQYQVAWNQGARRVVTRMIGADGHPVSGALGVSPGYILKAGFPALATRQTGDFVISWPPFGAEPGTVFARRYHLLLFEDGFETGDTSRWSTVE
jgi:hypothetical protein